MRNSNNIGTRDQMIIENVIHKDMKTYTRWLKRGTTLSAIGIGLGFILFSLPILSVVSGSFSLFWFAPIGFIMFGACAVSTSFFSIRYASAKAICVYIDYVYSQDYVTIADTATNLSANYASAISMVTSLIKTGNLDEYELIDNKVVARKDLNLSSDDLTTLSSSPYDVTIKNIINKPRTCPYCGAIKNKEDRICHYCGK